MSGHASTKSAVGPDAGAAGWLRARPHEYLLSALLVVLTVRYAWIMDDATIYFRYIDNALFLGRGLVFNVGEYVEGFTSPLWLLLLLVLRVSTLDYWTLTLGLGVVAAVVFCALLTRIDHAMSAGAADGSAPPSGNLPLALLCAHYGVASSFTSGLETGLVQLWAAVVALWLLQPRSRGLQVLIGLAPLLRPELALVTGLCVLRQWGRRRFVTPLGVSAAVANGGWLLFRVDYYADLLPNTFYLKNASNFSQGLDYLQLELEGGIVVLLCVCAVSALHFHARDPEAMGDRAEVRSARRFMLALSALMALWVVRIGGDMVYHRFFAFPACLALCATGGLWPQATAGLSTRARAVALGVVVVLGLGAYPVRVLSGHPLGHAQSGQWSGIEDALWHRRRPELRFTLERAAEDRKRRAAYANATADELTQRKSRLEAFCVDAFNDFGLRIFHTYGLTDAIAARIDAPLRRPGHRRLWAYARDLRRARALAGEGPGRGMHRRAVATGKAARWIGDNLPQIEIIEKKIYNRHDLVENLQLALTKVPRIAPGSPSRRPPPR